MIGTPEKATLKAYGIELLIVIFGITVAFQIEKLDDNRRETAAHETLRRGLMSEIDLNIDELTTLQEDARTRMRRTAHVVELLMAQDRSATQEIAAGLQTLAEVSLPDIEIGQLDAYLASDLSATSTARPDLIELRARLDELEEIGTYRVNYFLEHFLPGLSPYYDFANGSIVDEERIWDHETRNAMMMLASLEQSHIQTQRTALCSLLRARDALVAAGAEPDVSHESQGADVGACVEEN